MPLLLFIITSLLHYWSFYYYYYYYYITGQDWLAIFILILMLELSSVEYYIFVFVSENNPIPSLSPMNVILFLGAPPGPKPLATST